MEWILVVIIIFFAVLSAVIAHMNPNESELIWGAFMIFLLMIIRNCLKIHA